MKLGLINPKGTFFFEDEVFLDFWSDSYRVDYYKKAWSGISTGLLLVASLTPGSVEIKIIDENFDTVDYDEPFDIVGITAMTQQATRAYRIAGQFRRRSVPVVMGGIHATMLPHEAKLHSDHVIVGEAEALWPRFISDFLKGDAEPFYRKKNGKPVDIRQTPIPRYDLLDSKNYNTIWPQTTRGCPYNCNFCVASSIYGRSYRHKTVEQVIKELVVIRKTWKFPTICFADDNMFVNKSYAKSLIKEIMPLNLSWAAQSDISIGEDDQLLEMLFDSGCQVLYIGLESISEKNLNRIDPRNWKLNQLHKYPRLLENIQAHGVGVHGSFMVGLDHDDPDTFRRVADFIIDNNLFGGSISILSPYPGSRLREKFEAEDRLLDKPWSDYNGGNVTFLPKQMTVQQLQDGLIKIWRDIYTPSVQGRKRVHFKNIYKRLALKKREKIPGTV
jgi:radical SAM superfamily enzyme YgiQ (UPF0313 family)